MAVRMVTAAGLLNWYAPPAILALHLVHFQIPTTSLFTPTLPQKTQLNLECWEISIFLMTLRSDEPYLVPYLPVMPTFLVLLPMLFLVSRVLYHSRF